jgi:hypothetical protein
MMASGDNSPYPPLLLPLHGQLIPRLPFHCPCHLLTASLTITAKGPLLGLLVSARPLNSSAAPDVLVTWKIAEDCAH